MTVDVDVIMTAEGLTRFKDAWLGRGYVEKFAGSRGIRDTQTGVVIDVLFAGDYPGDGRQEIKSGIATPQKDIELIRRRLPGKPSGLTGKGALTMAIKKKNA